MKKSLAASLIAAPLLTLSFHAFAAAPDNQAPVALTSSQMDDITAGGRHVGWGRSFSPAAWRTESTATKSAEITQVNISPVTIIQIGNNNTAIVYSGNFSWIYQ